MRPISTNPDQPLQGAIADSLVLTFGINQFYGTADESQKLEAYELTEGFDADKSYYAESPGLMTGTRLGETTFKLRYGYVKADSALVTPWIVGSTKKRADSTRVLKPVRFNIKDTVLARRLLARIGTTDFSSLTEFQKVLKGVAIRPATSTSGAIVSLDPLASATRLTLYYHVSTDSLAHVHTFSLGNAAQQERYFTRITTDYSKGEQLTAFTPASTPAERDTVTAGPPHFTAYLQGGLELATRIRLTGFEPLLARQGHIAINRAELIVPVKPYAVGVYPVPGQAYLVEVDAQNRPLTTAGQLRTVQANGAYPAGTSQPAVVVYDPNLRAYRVVITSYLDARLNNKLTDQRGDAFWLVPTLPGVTGLGLNRALIDAAKDQIRLKVYYSELN